MKIEYIFGIMLLVCSIVIGGTSEVVPQRKLLFESAFYENVEGMHQEFESIVHEGAPGKIVVYEEDRILKAKIIIGIVGGVVVILGGCVKWVTTILKNRKKK